MRLILLLLALAAPAQAREISGMVAPPGTAAAGDELVIDLRAEGVVVAEERHPLTDPAFTLTTDKTGPLTLHVAVFAAGKPVWTASTAPLPPGNDPVALEPIPLFRALEFGFARPWRCGALRLSVTDLPDGGLQLRHNGKTAFLAKDATGFVDAATRFTPKGNRATLHLGDDLLPECVPLIGLGPLPLTARGQEPGFVLALARQGATFSSEQGETLAVPLAAPLLTPEGAVLKLAPDLTVVVSETLCHDAATGLPYPVSVTINREDGSFAGCGGDPLALLQGDWVVTEIDGTTPPPNAETTLSVSGSRVAGVSACNRYTGTLVLSAQGLSLPRLTTTRMACAPELAQVEARFLQTMAAVTGFDLDPDGTLTLLQQDRPVLRARP